MFSYPQEVVVLRDQLTQLNAYQAIRRFLRTQPSQRSLPIRTEQEDLVNDYKVEQHPVDANSSERDMINISRCYELMMGAGTAPNATCAQEHSCHQTEDSRPWSLSTFGNYLEDLGMLRPTKIGGDVSVGVLREYSGCTLDGTWTSESAGGSLSMTAFDWRANVTWGPTQLLDHRFDLASKFAVFDTNKDNFLSEDEFEKLSMSMAADLERDDAPPVFDFLPTVGVYWYTIAASSTTVSGKLLTPRKREASEDKPLVPKAFILLDVNEDERLTMDELTAGVAHVDLRFDADPVLSPSGEIQFIGHWTIREGDTWSTRFKYNPYLWASLAASERKAIAATWVDGGKAYATLDRTCSMTMRLMTETVDTEGIWQGAPPAPRVFLEFLDGRQRLSSQDIAVPIPPQEMYRRVFSGGHSDSRSASSVNARIFEPILSDCNASSIAGSVCMHAGEVLNLSVAARKMFENGTAPTDASALNLVNLWQQALTHRPYGADGFNSKTFCLVAMRLSPETKDSLTRLRYRRHGGRQGLDASLGEALRNSRFQAVLPFASYDKRVSHNRLLDLHVVYDIPRGDDFAQVLLDDNTFSNLEMAWFTSSDPKACAALAQVELHTGPIAQALAPDMQGVDSYFVDEGKLMAHGEAGLIAKCAAKGWFPSRSWTDVAELALPGENGRLLSSGTLEDISQEHGPVTSILVDPGAHSHLYASTRLGHPGSETRAAFVSPIAGTQALQFGRAANLDEHSSVPPSTRLLASAAISSENLIMLPNSRGTVMMQNQASLSLHEDGITGGLTVGQSAVFGHLHLKGSVEMSPTSSHQPPEQRDARHLEAVADFEERFLQGENDTVAGRHEYPQVPMAVQERVRIESEIAGQFPLAFSKVGTAAQPQLALAVDEPTKNNTLLMPDAMGTVLTTGDLPTYFDELVSPDLLYFSDASFMSARDALYPGSPGRVPDVAFGSPDSPITVEVNAAVSAGAFSGLVFEGWGDDGRTTRLAAESAGGRNILTLPDTDGTLLVAGALPDRLPFLTVLDRVDVLQGRTSFGASPLGGVHITVGAGVERSSAALHHVVSGRFPLQFSGRPAPSEGARDEDRENHPSDGEPSLQIEVTPSRRRNVITLPDVSGTVITTGNMDALLRLPHSPSYRITASSVRLTAPRILAFGSQASQLVARQSQDSEDSSPQTCATSPAQPVASSRAARGAFAFLDSSNSSKQSSDSLPKLDDNSLFIRAHGGVRLTTGIVQRSGGRGPLEVGVQVPAKGSGWSVLSDRNAKTNVSKVDDVWVLEALARVPVSTWRYAGAPEGEGVLGLGVTHMGPMAQDFNIALAPLGLGAPLPIEDTTKSDGRDDEFSRIHTSDADGALMAATRGMVQQIDLQNDAVEQLEAEVERLEAQLQANQARIERNVAVLSRHRALLSTLDAVPVSLS